MIDQYKQQFIGDNMNDADELEFDDYVLPVFIPKTQQVFLTDVRRISEICYDSQLPQAQSAFISKYLKQIFIDKIMRLFFRKIMGREDF